MEFWKTVPEIAQTKRYQGFGFEIGVADDDLRREYMQAYHACISFIDAQIGVVLAALKQTGQWDNTIVVLTSDHGYLLGEKFMWGKVMLFETCDRVPLVIRVPESIESAATTPGSSSEGLVELVDLFPTLTELCDVTPPSELQGQSMTTMLRDPASSGKDRRLHSRHAREITWQSGSHAASSVHAMADRRRTLRPDNRSTRTNKPRPRAGTREDTRVNANKA